MKVGLDISQTAFVGGVSSYTKNLARELGKVKDLEMIYFYSSLRQRYNGDLKNVKKFPIPPTLLEPLFNVVNLPIELLIGEVDIFHSSDWTQPNTRAKKVTTYHDIVPIKYPEWSTPEVVKVHQRRLKIVEQRIDKVIAVSEATKKDLLEFTKIPESKVVVIYEGVDSNFKPQTKERIDEFKKKHNLPDQFILAIAGVGNRRNIERLRGAAKDYTLIVTNELEPRVTYEEMPLLYASASMLAYPSFYEGFGLPVLEAMACGIPVLTSNVSSLPEVGGEAAYYVNPESLDEIKQGIDKLMQDQALQKDLIAKGFEQVKKFSWEKCAKETYNLYQELING